MRSSFWHTLGTVLRETSAVAAAGTSGRARPGRGDLTPRSAGLGPRGRTRPPSFASVRGPRGPATGGAPCPGEILPPDAGVPASAPDHEACPPDGPTEARSRPSGRQNPEIVRVLTGFARISDSFLTRLPRSTSSRTSSRRSAGTVFRSATAPARRVGVLCEPPPALGRSEAFGRRSPRRCMSSGTERGRRQPPGRSRTAGPGVSDTKGTTIWMHRD